MATLKCLTVAVLLALSSPASAYTWSCPWFETDKIYHSDTNVIVRNMDDTDQRVHVMFSSLDARTIFGIQEAALAAWGAAAFDAAASTPPNAITFGVVDVYSGTPWLQVYVWYVAPGVSASMIPCPRSQ